MKNQISALLMAFCFLGYSKAQTDSTATPNPAWVRSVSTDPMTGNQQVEWKVTAKQEDGRESSIYLLCSDANRHGAQVYYAPGTDINIETSMIITNSSPTYALVEILYRGALGKIRHGVEQVLLANPSRMTFDGGELKAMGERGSLVIQFPSADGYELTDVFNVGASSQSDSDQMTSDCFTSHKRKKH